jgi:hypothetical protein
MNPGQSERPQMPRPDLKINYGSPCPGSSNPMPPGRRDQYQRRIREAIETQAAGAELAANLFVRRSR